MGFFRIHHDKSSEHINAQSEIQMLKGLYFGDDIPLLLIRLHGSMLCNGCDWVSVPCNPLAGTNYHHVVDIIITVVDLLY